MDNMIALGVGIGTVGALSVVLVYLRRVKKALRKSVLRFENIKDKFD